MTSAFGSRILCTVVLLAAIASPALARGWDCHYEGTDGARYVSHFEKRWQELIEPHWPAPTAYRIVVDNRDMLIAVSAHADPRSFGRHAAGTATVVILNKMSGRMRRSTGGSKDEADRVEFGACTPY